MKFREILIPKTLGTLVFLLGLADVVTGLFLFFDFATSMTEGIDQSLNNAFHIQQGSNVAMILFGLFLMHLGRGLFSQRNRAWLWAEVFLFLSCINSLIPPITVHTAILSLIFMVVLAICRRHFFRMDQIQLNYKKAIAWVSVSFALIYGVMGSYLLRAEFSGIHSWIDAIYYTFVTYSTVGYGDIVPITFNAKLFTISMIVVGVVSFLTALSVLLGPVIQRNIKGVYDMVSDFGSRLNQHLLLCGDNLLTRSLANKYMEQGKACFFLEPAASRAATLEAAGFNVMHINPEDAVGLAKMNINKAIALISAYDSDAENVLVMMAAASLKKQREGTPLRLIARIEEAHNVDKAKNSGATDVFSPLMMSAKWIEKLLD